jgi:hypothetical protein
MMRLCLIIWLVLESGCSSYAVRCDSRLRPINPPRIATDVLQMPANVPTRSGRAPAAGDGPSRNP